MSFRPKDADAAAATAAVAALLEREAEAAQHSSSRHDETRLPQDTACVVAAAAKAGEALVERLQQFLPQMASANAQLLGSEEKGGQAKLEYLAGGDKAPSDGSCGIEIIEQTPPQDSLGAEGGPEILASLFGSARKPLIEYVGEGENEPSGESSSSSECDESAEEGEEEEPGRGEGLSDRPGGIAGGNSGGDEPERAEQHVEMDIALGVYDLKTEEAIEAATRSVNEPVPAETSGPQQLHGAKKRKIEEL